MLDALDGLVTLMNGAFPRRVTVRRAIRIARPCAHVFPLVASFRNGWVAWSPYGTQRDPSVVFAYEGPDSGVGAVQRWTAKRMGTGVMEMTRADPASGVAYSLALTAMGLSFEGECALDLDGAGGGCRDGCTVSWTTTMDLGSSRRKRVLGPLIRSGMGQAFEEGLAALKREAER
jgi:hypothetical protein